MALSAVSGRLRGRQTQFHVELVYGLLFVAGFGYLVFRVDPRVAAFEGGLVIGYLLRVWEKMSIYERILEEAVSREAAEQVEAEVEQQVGEEVEEQVGDEVEERVGVQVEQQVDEEVTERLESEVEERVEAEVGDLDERIDERVTEQLREEEEEDAGGSGEPPR